ncbi:MAG: TIGR02677 family protein [Bacilli bacterium]
MEIDDKLTKQITETKYLNVENASRYRPIIRYFFSRYEKLEYWFYKEDIYQIFKNKEEYNEYTIELCESDLESLVEWGSLTKLQDTSYANTIEEFKNRKFRYQLTEYAVEIERLVKHLENMAVETSSLEPKLFERIKNLLINLPNLDDSKLVNEWWVSLYNDFTTLNQNYQDFLKKFHEAKTENLMKSKEFLIFKDEMVHYLREFIKGFQYYNYYIIEAIKSVDKETINKIMNSLIVYQKSVPRLEPDFDFDYLLEINKGKWESIIKWFLGSSHDISESERLMKATNSIIEKIAKSAASIIEIRGNVTDRKQEYTHLATIFGKMTSIEDANKLSSLVFGINEVRHFTQIEKVTDDVNSSTYDALASEILLKSRSRIYKEKIAGVALVDKTNLKESQLKEYMKNIEEEKKLIEKYIKSSFIDLKTIGVITSTERRFLLNMITNALGKKDEVKDIENNISYTLDKTNAKEYVKIISDDGDFYLPNYGIKITAVNNHE